MTEKPIERVLLSISCNPGFVNQVKEQADLECSGNISQYVKKALKFYQEFGVKNGYVEKIKAAAEKEKRTPQGLVTSIVENYFDRVRYIKQFV